MQPQWNQKLRDIAYSSYAYSNVAYSNDAYSKNRFCAVFDPGFRGVTPTVI